MGFDPTTIFYVLVMAILQGVAEFLPISSSGHLLLLANIFHLPDALTLSILLHAGTLLSVLLYFARDILYACFKAPRVAGLVIVGSIPTAIIGFSIMYYARSLEENLLLAGCLFIVTGIILMTVMRSRFRVSEFDEYYDQIEANEEGDEEIEFPEPKTYETTTWLDAIFIGIAQGFAALPGLSRSGTTISAALARNFDREWAGKFSFLLSIPVIGGGALLEIKKIFEEAEGETFAEKFFSDPFFVVYLGGAVTSFLVGWFSLSILMRLLRDGRLHHFAWWLFIIGPATIIYWCHLNWETVLPILEKSEWISLFLQRIGLA